MMPNRMDQMIMQRIFVTLVCIIITNIASATSTIILNPMQQLHQVCQAATSKPFSPIKGCECNVGEVFTFNRRNQQYQCETRRLFNKEEMCGSRYGCIIQADYIVSLGDFIPDIAGAAATVRFANNDIQAAFLDKLDQVADNRLHNWHPHSNYYSMSEIRFDVGKSKALNLSNINNTLANLGVKEYLLKQNKVSANDIEVDGNIRFYSPDNDSLLHMLGLTAVNDQILKQAIPVRAILNNEGITNPYHSVVYLAYQAFLQKIANGSSLDQMSSWSVQLNRGNDCTDICRMSTDKLVINGASGFTMTVHQEVLRGMIHKRFINIISPTKNVDIIVQLTPNLYPSYILVRNYQKQWDNSIELVASLYDKNGSQLSSTKQAIIEPSFAQFLGNRKGAFDPTKPSLFLCEGANGHNRNTFSGIENNIVVGLEPTAFGWQSATDYSIKSFLSPLYTNDFGTLGLGMEDTGHIRRTSLAAKSVVPDIQLLPLGMRNCLDLTPQWFNRAQEKQIKVISISRNFFYEKSSKACKQNIVNKVTQGDGKNILWVVAAGNDGKENPRGYGCFNTDIYPNVITVASSSRYSSSLADYSNYGLHHADIVTTGDINSSSGTSYAAPRIAALAAKLSKDYPSLSPADLKAAILIGATPNSGLKDKVRSGAYVDINSAQFFENIAEKAECLTKNSSELRRECLGGKKLSEPYEYCYYNWRNKYTCNSISKENNSNRYCFKWWSKQCFNPVSLPNKQQFCFNDRGNTCVDLRWKTSTAENWSDHLTLLRNRRLVDL